MSNKPNATRIEEARLAWLLKARQLGAELAKAAFASPDWEAREQVLGEDADTMRWLGQSGDLWEDSEKGGTIVATHLELQGHLERTPYGFARYGGECLDSKLLALPALLDQFHDDSEPML